MAVKRKYRLNLRNYGNLPAIMLSQYDEGYALEFEIRDGTEAASDLSAYTVTLKGTRADTLAYSFAGTVSTNVLTFVIDTTMTACAGRGTAEIAIKDTANDVLFATFNMPVFVERAAVPEGSIDADVERAQEIAEQVQEIVDNAAAAVSGEAEKWATGQINGTDVPSTDPAYENNAKYYAEQAAESAASIGIDATLTQAGKAADAKETGDQITELKEDLSSIQTATASDVGKALKAKTVTNGKVTEWEFGESGGADPEEIEQAVTDWLDDHPEATTTVQDGSITEAKLATALVPTIKNDYVTPEMFGAKGDDVTDDTQAIRDMFASNNTVFVFDKKIYLVDGSIDVTKTCNIFFNETTLHGNPSGAYIAKRDYEYIIGFKAHDITTFGVLTVNVHKACNIGILLSNSGRSNFDVLSVSNARMWGICVDPTTSGNNSMNFNRIIVSSCGFKVHAKARKLAQRQLEITEMSSETAFWGGVKSSLFENEYRQCDFVIDDSGYTTTFLPFRLVFCHDRGEGSPFALDENDITKAIYTFNSSGSKVPNEYDDAENLKDVFIPIGGGLNFQSLSSEGVISIKSLITQSNPLGFRFMMGYAGHIGTYCSEYDTMVMMSNALALNINYLYTEAVGSGLKYKFGNSYDRIILFNSFNTCEVHVNSSLSDIKQGNNIVNSFAFAELAQTLTDSLQNVDFLARRKLTGINVLYNSQVYNTTVDENTARNITMDCNGFADSKNTITLDLFDINAFYTNCFEPMNFFVHRRVKNGYDSFRITLSSVLKDAGYTIRGAVDDVLTIHPSEYDNYVKITVILFRYNKEFCVTAEPLVFVDNTTTVDQSNQSAELT